MGIWKKCVVLRPLGRNKAQGHVKLFYLQTGVQAEAFCKMEQKESVCFFVVANAYTERLYEGECGTTLRLKRPLPVRQEEQAAFLLTDRWGNLLLYGGTEGVSDDPFVLKSRIQGYFPRQSGPGEKPRAYPENEPEEMPALRSTEELKRPKIPDEETATDQKQWIEPPAAEQQEEKNEGATGEARTQEQDQPICQEDLSDLCPQEQSRKKIGSKVIKREKGLKRSTLSRVSEGESTSLRCGWVWEKMDYAEQSGFYYWSGTKYEQGEAVLQAVAVPGNYAPVAPANLQGFSQYVKGYWVLAQRMEDKEKVLITQQEMNFLKPEN